MNFLEMVRNLPSDFSDAEFVRELRKAIDLDEIKNLSDEECQNLFDVLTFLLDYVILLQEFKGLSESYGGYQYYYYRGPMILNRLTRATGAGPDFSQLTTFGIGNQQN